MLFCTDFSENADYAFEFAFGIAKRDEGLLYILHVIPDNPLIPHERNKGCAERFVKSDVLENIQKCVQEDLNKKFTEHYVKKIQDGVQFKIVTRSGREDDEIIRFANEKRVDIIVMGTQMS